ncbi:MAG: hypothetical protein WDO17_19600 [Alphaproteobacteria bacterium]
MGFPLCKLIDMTGPLEFPASVALARVDPGQEPIEVVRLTLVPNDEIQATLFEFDNQEFIPFANDVQLRFKLVATADGRDLGETIIGAEDVGQGDKTANFRPAGIGGPSYDVTYKVLPG